MLRKDPIFWCAAGIFILSLLISAITNEQLWLLLMIASYLLRPTLASLGLAKRQVDERQMSIHYRSGNIGFVAMIIACVIFSIKLGAENNHDFEMFISAIIIGLVAKALFNVILIKDFRKSASKIIMAVGLLVTLFSVLDAKSFVGFIISAVPGLAIACIGLLARRYPRITGVVIIMIAIVSMAFLLSIRKNWGQLITAIVVGVPLLTAGIALFKSEVNDTEMESKVLE